MLPSIASLILAVAASAAASAGTPGPTPTTTPTPAASASPTPSGEPKVRSLADVARERKLVPLKGAVAGENPPPEPPGPLRVEDLEDGGVSDGFLSVYGRVRNAGAARACRVRLFLRTFGEQGVLLAKGETTTDLKVVAPGDAVPFGVRLKVPAGVRGSQERAPDAVPAGTPRTNFQRVARVEGEVLDFSQDCP